jgi:membrane protein required for colicin V production
MNVLDIIFLVPLLFALYRGFRKGLIHMVASLLALILGILGAIKFRPVFASFIDSLFNVSPEHVNVIAFSVAFVVIVLVVHLAAFLAEKLIKAVALNFVNRLLGMGFGFLVTAFVISMILWPVNQVTQDKQIIRRIAAVQAAFEAGPGRVPLSEKAGLERICPGGKEKGKRKKY